MLRQKFHDTTHAAHTGCVEEHIVKVKASMFSRLSFRSPCLKPTIHNMKDPRKHQKYLILHCSHYESKNQFYKVTQQWWKTKKMFWHFKWKLLEQGRDAKHRKSIGGIHILRQEYNLEFSFLYYLQLPIGVDNVEAIYSDTICSESHWIFQSVTVKKIMLWKLD